MAPKRREPARWEDAKASVAAEVGGLVGKSNQFGCREALVLDRCFAGSSEQAGGMYAFHGWCLQDWSSIQLPT